MQFCYQISHAKYLASFDVAAMMLSVTYETVPRKFTILQTLKIYKNSFKMEKYLSNLDMMSTNTPFQNLDQEHTTCQSLRNLFMGLLPGT